MSEADLIKRLDALEARNQSLEAEVRYLRDRRDIEDVVTLYSRALDRHDWELFRSIFHDDGIDEHGDFVGSVADYVSHFKVWFSQRSRLHTHNITSHICEIDGDTAHSETYVLFCSQYEDLRVAIGNGRYIDKLTRKNGVWKIAVRRTYVDWRFQVQGLEMHGGYPRGTFDKTDLAYVRPLEVTDEMRAKMGKFKAQPTER